MAGIPVDCIFVEQTTQQTTTSSTFVDISGAEITSGNFTVGEKYLITISSQHGGSDGESFGVRVLHGSTAFAESEVNVEPKESGASPSQFPLSYGWFTVWTAVSGEGIKLQFKDDGATVKADQISMVAMSLKDLAENTDYFFDSNSTSTALTGTFSSTNNASITINPALASDWLVMAYSRLDPVADSKGLETKIETTGGITSSLPLLRTERDNEDADIFDHFMIRPFSLTAVSHTFTEKSRNSEGDSNGSRTHSGIFAINMSRFKQHSFSYTEAFVAGTAGTSEIQTTSITPTELRDVWVGTFYVFDPFDATSASDTGSRMQVDNVDQPATQTSDSYELGRSADPTDLKRFYIQSVENLSASAHNIDLDVFDTNVNNKYGRRVAFAIECALTEVVNTIDKEFTVDAILEVVNTIDKEFTVDAFLQAEQVFNFTVDALIQGEITKFFLVDAFIQDTFVEDFTVDAFIELEKTINFTIDAFIQAEITKTFLVDGFIQETFTTTVNNIDAIISQPSPDKNEPDYFLVIDESTLEVTGDVKEPTGFNTFTLVQIEEIVGFLEWYVDNVTQLNDIFEDLNTDKDTLWKIYQRFKQGGYGADPLGELEEAMECMYRLYVEKELPTNYSDDLDFDTRKLFGDFRPGD